MMNTLLLSISLPVVAYLAGSIPFGLLFVRLRAKTDLREIGSGNIGTTNVRRALGTSWAVATLICDILKGFLPAMAALHFFPEPYLWLPAIVAIAAICGHIHPVYLHFKPSGKGVATTLGCLLVIAPVATLLYLMVLAAAIYFSRRVSVGSLIGAQLLPPAAWFTTHDPVVCAATIWIMIWILIRHRENIQRLASGVEPAIRFNRRQP